MLIIICLILKVCIFSLNVVERCIRRIIIVEVIVVVIFFDRIIREIMICLRSIVMVSVL